MILRKDYLNYEDALKLTNLQSLDERREAMSLRFAKNCLNNQNFSKLFPHNSQKHVMKVRNPQKYRADRDNHVIVSSRDESRRAQISEPDLDSGL